MNQGGGGIHVVGKKRDFPMLVKRERLCGNTDQSGRHIVSKNKTKEETRASGGEKPCASKKKLILKGVAGTRFRGTHH